MDAISSLSGVSAAAQQYTTVSSQAEVGNANPTKNEFAKALNSVTNADNPKSVDFSDKVKVAMEFETMVLSQFIGEMIKEQTAGAFGDGAEGDYFTSIFSDAISKQLSEAGGFGIAKLI